MCNQCKNCECHYYVGRKYHKALMRIFWTISKYLITKLSIPDIHNLEDEIVELERIYEGEDEEGAENE